MAFPLERFDVPQLALSFFKTHPSRAGSELGDPEVVLFLFWRRNRLPACRLDLALWR